jgi:hypothetical protein
MSYPTNQLAINLDEMWMDDETEWKVGCDILWLDIDQDGSLVMVPRLSWYVTLHWTTEDEGSDWVKRTWTFYDNELEVALLHAVDWCKALLQFSEVGATASN